MIDRIDDPNAHGEIMLASNIRIYVRVYATIFNKGADRRREESEENLIW